MFLEILCFLNCCLNLSSILLYFSKIIKIYMHNYKWNHSSCWKGADIFQFASLFYIHSSITSIYDLVKHPEYLRFIIIKLLSFT